MIQICPVASGITYINIYRIMVIPMDFILWFICEKCTLESRKQSKIQSL